MPVNRSWGRHYENGDIVLTWYDDLPLLLLVTGHTGDYHHAFVGLSASDETESPRESDHLITQLEKRFSGYWVGPKVGHLDEAQHVCVGSGIDVPKLVFTVKQVLAAIESKPPRPVQKHYTT